MIYDKKSFRNYIQKIYESRYLDTYTSSFGTAYSQKEKEIERFSRPLYAICWDKDCDKNLLSQIGDEIKDCCNPQRIRYWGKINDYSQTNVELIPIALTLLNHKEIIWNNYSCEEKENISRWFLQINNIKLNENNWLFFRIIINLVFFQLDICESPSVTCKQDFETIELMYKENGWYSDGFTEQHDYYIAFAFHYYSLIYSVYAQNCDTVRAIEFKKRAALFASNYIYWFSSRGDCVPFGRSLIYRFASVAFWAAVIWADIKFDFSKSMVKGIIFRNLRWWEEKEIIKDGHLSLGYAYSNDIITEQYNSVFSPFWCLKVAILLDVDDTSAFWKDEESIFPKLDNRYYIKASRQYIERLEESVLLFNCNQQSKHRIINGIAKYEKYVYSNICGFTILRDSNGLASVGADSTLIVSLDDRTFIPRSNAFDCCSEEWGFFSKWKPYGCSYQVSIDSYIVTGNPFHIRIHQIHTNRLLYVYDCGFSYPSDGAFGYLCYAQGYTDNSDTILINQVPNSNILFPNTCTNAIKYILYPGNYTIIDGFGVCDANANVVIPNVSFKKNRVRVVFDKNARIINLRKRIHLIGEKYYSLKGKTFCKVMALFFSK